MADVYARALRGSQNVQDAPDGWTGRGRVREWKSLVWGGVIFERITYHPRAVSMLSTLLFLGKPNNNYLLSRL